MFLNEGNYYTWSRGIQRNDECIICKAHQSSQDSEYMADICFEISKEAGFYSFQPIMNCEY
jgi:hypothetical protein